jgi:hypothetical protein
LGHDLLVVLFIKRFVNIFSKNNENCVAKTLSKGGDNAHAVARMIIAGPVLDLRESDAIASKINLPIVASVGFSGAIAVASARAGVFNRGKNRGGKTPRIRVRPSIAA